MTYLNPMMKHENGGKAMDLWTDEETGGLWWCGRGSCSSWEQGEQNGEGVEVRRCRGPKAVLTGRSLHPWTARSISGNNQPSRSDHLLSTSAYTFNDSEYIATRGHSLNTTEYTSCNFLTGAFSTQLSDPCRQLHIHEAVQLMVEYSRYEAFVSSCC